MPVRLRLAGLFALGTALAVVVTSVVLVHFLAAGLRTSLDAGLRVRADTIATTLDTAVPAPPVASATVRGQGDGLAQVFGPSGRLVAFSPDAGDVTLISAAQLARARHQVVAYSIVIAGSSHGGEGESESPRAGEHTRVFAVPVARSQGAWVIVVGSSLDTTDAAIHRVTRAGALGATPIVAVAAGAAWLLASAALRPVERMRREVADISAHEPHAGIEVPTTRDEIAALARTMNDLLARLGEALDRERSFVADAGHELRTPLATLRTELELASRPGRSRAELTCAVAAAAEETDRLARLAEDLLLLARSDNASTLRRHPSDLHRLLGEAVDGVAVRAAEGRVAVSLEVPADLEVDLDPDRLRQAVDNLLDNALRHSPPDSRVRVRAAAEGTHCTIEVSDEGPGFPPEFLPHAFERFRRADPARAPQDGGTGLGLAIVASIARAHGGTAEAANRPEGGARVRISLPMRSPGTADRL